jgi:hypothetical protein
MGSYTDEASAKRPRDLSLKAATALVFVGIGVWCGYELLASGTGFSGATQLFLFSAPCALFPAALLLFANRTFRAFIFVVGLAFGFATQTFMSLGGPDSPGLIIPWLGFCPASGAALAEVVMLFWGRVRRRSRQKES